MKYWRTLLTCIMITIMGPNGTMKMCQQCCVNNMCTSQCF